MCVHDSVLLVAGCQKSFTSRHLSLSTEMMSLPTADTVSVCVHASYVLSVLTWLQASKRVVVILPWAPGEEPSLEPDKSSPSSGDRL